MSSRHGLYAAATMAVALASPAHAQGCYDVAKSEPRSLTGTLTYVVFPGPPNFEDVQRGDTPEPNYVLRLDNRICITGDEFADPAKGFNAVQIVETKPLAGQLRRYIGKVVTVTLTQPMAAQTGHHHEPLVAWATAVRAAPARPMDFVDQYGTAATTIRTFYVALRDGQGAVASAMIVPEKRAMPVFSAAGLTRFYGGLKRPIQLVDISQNSATVFMVHYRYGTATRTCDGRAVVTTLIRGGRNFIQGIRPLDGC